MYSDADGMHTKWEPWLTAWSLADLRPAPRSSFTSYVEAIAAAVAGQGEALGRRPLVVGLLTSGQLVSPFDAKFASARAYQLIVDPASSARPAVRAFEAWLLGQAGA